MSLEVRQIPSEKTGSLQGCLVEGDPEQYRRERRLRRRALALSIVMQGVVLAAIVLIPLFGKPAHVALANAVPLPPYYSHVEARRALEPVQQHPHPPQNICRICAPARLPPTIPTRDFQPPDDGIGDSAPISEGLQMTGLIPLVDSRDGIKPPHPETQAKKPEVIHQTHIDPAMLTYRVEPVYPTLPRQLGRSGRVELRAIIATDGTIQSLQVVGGDPLFYQSALEAVRQWRYTPTVLNGRAVEIDIYITAIYSLQR